jgi:hypothetical protein
VAPAHFVLTVFWAGVVYVKCNINPAQPAFLSAGGEVPANCPAKQAVFA